MSYQEWKQRTRLGINDVRPEKLREVDNALNVYNRIPTPQNELRLTNALTFKKMADGLNDRAARRG